MELDRRQFLKWSAGLAALLSWACKAKDSSQSSGFVDKRLASDVQGLSARMEPTVLRAGGKAFATQVEVWDGKPMGVRGPASAMLLDWLPLFWMPGQMRFAWERDLPSIGAERAVELLGARLRDCRERRKPLLVVSARPSSVGWYSLLSQGATQGLWEWAQVGSATDSGWTAWTQRMRAGEFAGMLVLGLDLSADFAQDARTCWESAPWKAAMLLFDGDWAGSADLRWPLAHPFADWDCHGVEGAVLWQRPVVDSPMDFAGMGVLLAAWLDKAWDAQLWRVWLSGLDALALVQDMQKEGGAVDNMEWERPRSPWFLESIASAQPMRGEPELRWLPAQEPRSSETVRWGMLVDLRQCDRCGACVLACMLENNVPTVGKREFAKGRGMQWLRLAQGIPLMCQHCALAPCEAACPVKATSHSQDGLNEQTYVRCVGARYCAIHCPWKTRRFGYGVLAGKGVQLQFNPRVPLRPQGVMEKCTFCVQRIRERADGQTVVPACAECCERGALHFGNWNDAASPVRRAAQGQRLWRLASLGEEDPSVLYIREDS